MVGGDDMGKVIAVGIIVSMIMVSFFLSIGITKAHARAKADPQKLAEIKHKYFGKADREEIAKSLGAKETYESNDLTVKVGINRTSVTADGIVEREIWG